MHSCETDVQRTVGGGCQSAEGDNGGRKRVAHGDGKRVAHGEGTRVAGVVAGVAQGDRKGMT